MAVLSVTIPDAAVSRVRNAVAVATSVAAPATLSQVQDLCRDYLRAICLQVESQARQAAVPSASETAVAADFPKP